MTYNPETPVFLANCDSLFLTMHLTGNRREELYTEGACRIICPPKEIGDVTIPGIFTF